MMIWLIGADGMLGTTFATLLQSIDLPFIPTTIHDLDITDPKAVHAFIGDNAVTHIINCAAYTLVDKAEEDRSMALTVNAEALHHLATAAAAHDAYILHFSTDYVFDGTKKEPYHENDSCIPVNYYGITKRLGEENLLKTIPQRCCIIRTSWLYGLHGNNFVFTMLRLFRERDALSVVADQYGSPTLCDDLVRVSLRLLEKGTTGIFHYSNKDVTTWYDFSCAIQKYAFEYALIPNTIAITPISTDKYPTPARRPQYSAFDMTKLEKTTGPTYFRPWDEALRDFLLQYKEISDEQKTTV
jgi:dTDP-4-dehydrorhamnose reductase